MKQLIFIVLFVPVSLLPEAGLLQDYGWSQVYMHRYSEHEMQKNSDKKELIITQLTTLPFNQLIFSWNAQRPQEGYFTFSCQVRDAQTNQWYDYLTMINWGDKLQKSHFSRAQNCAFYYARLEIENNRKADGFRIKVQATDQHDLGLVKALFASVSDMSLFAPEPWAQQGKNLETLILKNIPQTSQFLIDHPKADVMCSPTSVSMVVGSLKRTKLDPLLFADAVYDQGLNAFGNWAFNTAHAYELCNGQVLFYPARLGSFTDLYQLLEQKIPVVVSVHGPLKDAPRPYQKGHLLVVVGYDAHNKKVLCHDPAFETDTAVAMAYDLHEFVRAWERSKRMVYCAFL